MRLHRIHRPGTANISDQTVERQPGPARGSPLIKPHMHQIASGSLQLVWQIHFKLPSQRAGIQTSANGMDMPLAMTKASMQGHRIPYAKTTGQTLRHTEQSLPLLQ